MHRLLELIANLTKSKRIRVAARDRLAKRAEARHDEMIRLHTQAEAAEVAADKQRRNGHLATARRKDAKARRLHRAANVRHDKVVSLRERIREQTKLIRRINTDLGKAEREVAAMGPQVDLDKQKVTGGTVAERGVVAGVTSWQCCAKGRRRNAYSQAGSPDIWHPFGPGPAPGRRDDCSSFVTSMALACGFDDPNGLDFSGQGFTGTLVLAHGRWKQATLAQMKKAGTGYIVYGSGGGFHVEWYAPSKADKERTIGHGSAPVDPSTIHMMGSGVSERYFIFDP